jgi:hypothetical protein
MDATVGRMEAQLKRWKLKIENLAAKAHAPGGRSRFETVMYIDELKALHAIAQSRFVELQAAGDPDRARLRAEMTSPWEELAAALKNPAM